MIKKYLIFFIFLTSASFSVTAIEKYVTDDSNIFLRRGPSLDYGLVGSLKPGDKVEVLETSLNGKFTRIQDANGRIAWIDSSELSNQPSVKSRLPALEQQLAEYKSRVDNQELIQQTKVKEYIEKLSTADEKISLLEQQNNELKKQVKEQALKLDSALNQVDEKRQELIFKWFTYGGIVAGSGLLIGLIVPFLLPKKRRRNDRWMN